MAEGQKPTKLQPGNKSVGTLDEEGYEDLGVLEETGYEDLGTLDDISMDPLHDGYEDLGALTPTAVGNKPIGPPEQPARLRTDEDRKNRISAIDAEINQIDADIRKESDGLYKELGFEEELKRKERKDFIENKNYERRELAGERKEINRDLLPIDSKVREEILQGVKGMDFLNQIAKFGENNVTQVLSEERSENIGSYYKSRYERITPSKYDQTKFNFAYMIHGNREPLKHDHTTPEESQTLWLDIRDDLAYRDVNFLARRAYIGKRIQDYVNEKYAPKEGEEPVSKTKKDSVKAELQEYMLDAYNFTDQGGLSNNGVQSFAEYVHGISKDYFQELMKERQRIYANMPGAYTNELAPTAGVKIKDINRLGPYLKYIEDEISRINTVQKYSELIIAAPTSVALSSFGQGLERSHSPEDLLSMGITEMVDAFRLQDIAMKTLDGNELTHGEDLMMAMYLGLQQADSFERKEIKIGNTGITIRPENIGKNITAMLPYIATFAGSGFIYEATAEGVAGSLTKAGETLTKLTGKKLINKTLFKYGKDKTSYTLGDLAVKNASRVVGTAAQTTFLPQYYLNNTARRMIEPGTLTFDSEDQEVLGELTRNDLSTGKAAKRGYWEAYSEIFTERAGLHLMKPFGVAKKGIAKGIKNMTGKQASQLTFVKYLGKMKGIKTNSQMKKLIVERQFGWHGAGEEYLEELANLYMASIGTKDGVEYGGGKFLSGQLETFLTVGIFGGAANISQWAIQEAIGDDIKFSRKDGTSFKLPYDLYKNIKSVFNNTELKGESFGEGLAEAMKNYKGKLTPEQEKGVMQLTMEHVIKRNALETIEQNQDPKATTDILEGFESTEATPETVEPVDVRPKQSVKERKSIDAFNKNIEERFPDLVHAEMVPKNPNTGQYERPDAEWMEAKLAAIENEINSKAMRGQKSNKIMNRNDEIKDLEFKQNMLRNYLHAFEEYSSIPWSELVQSEKHSVLATELRIDGPQQASIDYMAEQGSIGIKMDNGRVLRGEWKEDLDKEEKKKLQKRMDSNERFTISLKETDKKDPNKPLTKDIIEVRDKSNNKVIGTAVVQNYRGEEEARIEKYKDILAELKKNLTGAGAFGAEWLADQIKARNLAVPSEDLANEFRNRLFALISNIKDIASMSVSDVINLIRRAIKQSTTLLEVHKDYLLDMLDYNIDQITMYIVAQKREAGISVPNVKLRSKVTHASDLRIRNSEAVTLTGAMKIEENLRTFAPLWRELADDLKIGRDHVEKTFYKMLLDNPMQSPNEDMFQFYLDENKSSDRVQNAIIEKLRTLDWGTNISLFAFYENVRLIRQFGYFINKKGQLQRKDLNPPQNLQEFINKFINRTEQYEYTVVNEKTGERIFKGIDAIKVRIAHHRAATNKRAERFMENTPERRTELRKEQHEADLELLSELTGINISVWEDYFTSKTKETVAFTTPDLKKEQDYKSYDKLLEKDTYAPAKGGSRPRIQSSIAAQLTFMLHKDNKGQDKTDDEYREGYLSFFSEGNEERDVYSNLFKLSTANKNTDDIGLRGWDVKDDMFSSFMQNSMIMKIIMEEGMDFIVQGGMRNIKEKKQGTTTQDMSLTDIWVSAFAMFLENPDNYYQNIGQFSDKPALYYIMVEKIKGINIRTSTETNPLTPELEEAAKYMFQEYLIPNQGFFIELGSGGYKGTAAHYEGKDSNEKLMNLARDFVANYAHNAAILNQKFHGNLPMYAKMNEENELVYDDAFVDMVKRAGSSNSPGYLLNRWVDGGVGMTYDFGIVNDDIEGLGEIFDGLVFVTGEYMAKMAVSMGDVYYKPEEYDELSSVKALSSFIDPETQNRSLTKGNWVNIDILAKALPDTAYGDIQKLMKKSKRDVLSFTSTNKKLEKGKAANLFDKKGRITNFDLPLESRLTRTTDNIFIQQDLRHAALPKDSKHPVQFLANMLVLPHAKDLIETIYSYQQMIINDFKKTLSQKETLTGKLDWIIKNTNRFREEELYEMLYSGMLPTEPAVQALLRTKLSSEVTARALELPVNRSTTQEIPDPNKILKSRRPSKDGLHILLPQCGVSFPDVGTDPKGVRYPQKMRSQEEAEQHVKAQQDFYPDLFMPDGEMMTWEIEDGVIPGEPIMLTRIPADHPHSHTIARATVKIPGGNFTMLDKESQIASGSDFDGDYRFNTVFYKGRTGKINMDTKTKRGKANQILYNTMLDYMDPEYDEYIKAAINIKIYKPIIDKWKTKRSKGKFKSNNPRALEESRLTNKVGVDMKGILTDLSTVFSLLSYLKTDFKTPMNIEGLPGLRLSGIVNDNWGMMKIHLANLLNMAFDNAKDPGLEYLGFNEVTAQMFILALVGNKNLDSTKFKNAEDHFNAILKEIDNLSTLFNSKMYQDFIYRMRYEKGATGTKQTSEIFTDMGATASRSVYDFDEESSGVKPWGADKMNNLRSFYYAANELTEVRTFFNLTKKAPLTSADFYMAQQIIKKVKRSSRKPKKGEKPARNAFSLINTSSFYTNSGEFHHLFRIINDTMAISQEVIFSDSFEHTNAGKQILSAIWRRIKKNNEKKIDFNRDDLKSIIRAINTVVAVQALKPKRTARNNEILLVKELKTLKEMFPGNKFLDQLRTVLYDDPTKNDRKRRTRGVEIKFDSRYSGISEEEIKEIQNDFDKLPEKLQNSLMQNILYRWGTTLSRKGGSPYEFVGRDYRVAYSRNVWMELERWKNDELSPEDKLDITEMALRSIYEKELRSLSLTKPYFASEIDPASAGIIDYPITYEALDALTTVQSEEDLAKVIEEHSIDINDLTAYALRLRNDPSITTFAQKILERRESVAIEEFGQHKPDPDKTHNMLPEDSLGEVLLSEDPELERFVFEHLSTTYPGVQFFTNRDAFYRFVVRNGGRLMDIETSAIGHAFGNAVFIDPEKAVQSSLIHEYGHVYWDALPEDDPAKEALRFFYLNNTDETFADLDELDEKIIRDIGKVGTNRARIQFKGSVLQRFMQLVKDFWRAVKKLLGTYTEADILTDMAIAVWNNKGKMGPLTMPGRAVMRNMIKYPSNEGENNENNVTFGSKFTIGATKLKNLFKNTVYDAERNAKKSLEKMNTGYKEKSKYDLPEEIKVDELERLLFIDNQSNEAGIEIHKIAEHVFGKEKVDLIELDEKFIDNERLQHALRAFTDIKKWIESDSFKLYLQNVMGFTGEVGDISYETEYKLIDTENGVTGKIDLIIDLGNNKIIIVDFKTTNFSFVDDKGNLEEKYTTTSAPYRNPIGFLSESRQNDDKLQLHTYKRLAETIDDPAHPGEKNEVVGMMIIPILRIVDPILNKISQVSIPRVDKKKNPKDIRNGKIVKVVEVSPTEKRIIRAIDLMFDSAKKKTSHKNDLIKDLTKNMKDKGFMPEIIDEMELAFDFFETFLPNGLKEAKAIDLEGILSTSWTAILSKLPDLGYTKDDIIGPDKLNIEQLFWAATRKIRKEDLANEFKDYTVYSTFVRHELDNPIPKGWYKFKRKRGTDNKLDSDLIIYDAGWADLQEGDSFLRIYPFLMKSGVQEYPAHSYQVLEVKVTHDNRGATVIVLDEQGNEQEFKDIQKEDSIHKIHPGITPIPSGITVQDKFVARHYYSEEKHKESHYNMNKVSEDYGSSGDQRAAWQSIDTSMRKLWVFFNNYDTIPKLRKFLDDQDAVSEYLDILRTSHPDITGALTEMLIQTAMNHHFAEFMRRENEFGPTGLMPVTLEAYYMVNGQEEVMYRDFPNSRYLLRPDRMIPLEYIPFSMMEYTIMAAMRRVHIESYEHNAKVKELNKDLDMSMMTETDPQTEIVKWVYPDDPSVLGTKEAEALEHIYSMYAKYDAEYMLLMKNRTPGKHRNKYPQKIIVSKSFMTRQEFRKEHGKMNGKLLHDHLKAGPYDAVKVTIEEKVPRVDKKGKKRKSHKYVSKIDAEGNLVTMSLRDIKDIYISENLDKEGIRFYFGNKFQQFIMRNKLLSNISGSQLSRYERAARENYKDKERRNNLGYDIRQHRRKIHKPGLSNPKFATKHILEGEQKAIDRMIFRHYMKNTLGPLEYTIAKYNGIHDQSFAGEWLRKWSDKVIFNLNKDQNDELFRLAFDFLIRVNSLNKIAFSATTQVTNFVVGQSFDMIFEPKAMREGLARLADPDPIKMINNIRKARNILSYYGIVNITDETEFEKLEKENYVLGLPVHKIENIGYAPMDFIEKFNQFPVFVGLMTELEWNAHAQDGTIIDRKNALSEFRTHAMAIRVRGIHGDYGVMAAAPGWYAYHIAAILQFRKWGPGLVYKWFHDYAYNQEFLIDGGMINGLAAIGKIMIHNIRVKRYGEREELNEAVRKLGDLAKKKELGPLQIDSLDHYINILIKNFDGKGISLLKDLPKSEVKAFRTLVYTAVVSLLSALLMHGLWTLFHAIAAGDDDDELIRKKQRWWKQMKIMVARNYSDIWYVANIDQWMETAENLVPFISMIMGVVNIVRDTKKLIQGKPGARYGTTTFDTGEALPKMVMDMFRLVPGGALMRQLYSAGHLWNLHHSYDKIYMSFENEPLTLGDGTNVYPDIEPHEISRYQAMEYDRIMKEIGFDLEKYFYDKGFKEIDVEMEDYAGYNSLKKRNQRTLSRQKNAERLWGYLHIAKNRPEIEQQLREAIINHEKYVKIFGHADEQTVRANQKSLSRMMEQLGEEEGMTIGDQPEIGEEEKKRKK